MQQKILKYGLASGSVIVLIPVLASFVIGTGPESFKMGEIIGYSTMILSLLVIFFAVNEYKKQHLDKPISFGQILMLGAGISAIAGIMFGIYNWVYVAYIAPEFLDQYFNYYIETIRNSGASQIEIDTQIAKLNQEKEIFMNPLVNFLVMFATVFVIGLIVSIVSAFSQSSKNIPANSA